MQYLIRRPGPHWPGVAHLLEGEGTLCGAVRAGALKMLRWEVVTNHDLDLCLFCANLQQERLSREDGATCTPLPTP